MQFYDFLLLCVYPLSLTNINMHRSSKEMNINRNDKIMNRKLITIDWPEMSIFHIFNIFYIFHKYHKIIKLGPNFAKITISQNKSRLGRRYILH
jgi:hypothetical protein